MNKIFYIILIIILVNGCSNQTIYSGKILNEDNLNNINFKTKENLVSRMGSPSFIDPIDKKFFYYSEKNEKKSIFNKKTKYSYVFVFKFNEKDQIIESKVFNLKNKKDIKYIEDETSSEVVKRGLIEKIFGGVGTQSEIPTTP